MIETIEYNLNLFPFYKLLTFSACIVKRLSSNYKAFYLKEKWGDPLIIENGLQTLFHISLEKRDLSNQEFELIDKIVQITPDSEQFPSVLATAAQDVCVVLLESLSSIPTKDKNRIISLVSLPMNSLRMYIEDAYKLDYNKKNHDAFVNNHELIQKEYTFLDTLVHNLSIENEINPSIFEQVEKITYPL